MPSPASEIEIIEAAAVFIDQVSILSFATVVTNPKSSAPFSMVSFKSLELITGAVVSITGTVFVIALELPASSVAVIVYV